MDKGMAPTDRKKTLEIVLAVFALCAVVGFCFDIIKTR